MIWIHFWMIQTNKFPVIPINHCLISIIIVRVQQGFVCEVNHIWSVDSVKMSVERGGAIKGSDLWVNDSLFCIWILRSGSHMCLLHYYLKIILDWLCILECFIKTFTVYLMVQFLLHPNTLILQCMKGHPCPVWKHAEVNDPTSIYLDLVNLRNSSLKCSCVFRHHLNLMLINTKY